MRSAWLVFLFALSTAVFAQADDPKLGMTSEAIVRLGRAEWINRFTERHGEATATLSAAEETYAASLAEVNDKLPKALRPEARANWLELRLMMLEAGKRANEMGRASTGGGTKWFVQANASVGDAEEALHHCLTNKISSSHRRTQAQAWDSFKKARAILVDTADDIDASEQFTGMDAGKALGSLAEFGGLLSNSIKRMGSLSAPQKGRLFHFFWQQTQLIG